MNIIWKEWDVTPKASSLGHGMPFLDRRRGPKDNLVAFVDGFYWLNDKTTDQYHDDIRETVYSHVLLASSSDLDKPFLVHALM